MHIAQTLAETYSVSELETSRRTILEALLSPDSVLGNQLDGVSFQFAPRTVAELESTLGHVRAALNILSGTASASTVRGRFIDFSTRQME